MSYFFQECVLVLLWNNLPSEVRKVEIYNIFSLYCDARLLRASLLTYTEVGGAIASSRYLQLSVVVLCPAGQGYGASLETRFFFKIIQFGGATSYIIRRWMICPIIHNGR